MKWFRIFNTIAFWQIIITIIIASAIGFPLIFSYCSPEQKSQLYVIIPMISVVVASIAYFLNKIDKSRNEIKVTIVEPIDKESAENTYQMTLTANNAYLIDRKLEKVNNFSDSMLNKDRAVDSKFINLTNASRSYKMTITLITKLENGLVKHPKTINPGGDLSIMLLKNTNLKIKYYNHKKYCKKEEQVLND